MYFKHRLLEGATHRTRGESSMLRRRPLLVPEARGWGLMLRQRRVVMVMVVGLVGRRGRVAVVVVGRVVRRRLLHAGVRRLGTDRWQYSNVNDSYRGQYTDKKRFCHIAMI